MTTKKKFDYPQLLTKKEKMTYTPILKSEMKALMVIGRVYYSIMGLTLRGHGVIRPRMRKGNLLTTGDPVCQDSYLTATREEESMADYHAMLIATTEPIVLENALFYKKDEPLVKFNYES